MWELANTNPDLSLGTAGEQRLMRVGALMVVVGTGGVTPLCDGIQSARRDRAA